jgi:hypothetical protein
MPTLRVPNENEPSACVARDGRRDLAGECAFWFPMDVLDADDNVWSLAQRFRYRVERKRRREKRD